MSFTEADLKGEALDLIQVEGAAGKIRPKGYDRCIARAIETYSRDRPREIAVDLVGDGTGVFLLSSLSGYIDGFSGDVQIEYPIVTDGEQIFIDRREWSIATIPGAKALRMHSHKPNGPNDKARFIIKTKHAVDKDDPSKTTVIEIDRGALAKLVAAEICELFASYHTHTGDGTFVNADISYFKSKRSEFEGRSKVLRAQYSQQVGKSGDDGPRAATVVTNTDNLPSASVPGIGRITHDRRWR